MQAGKSITLISACLSMTALILMAGCRDQNQGPQGKVKATDAYVEAFGEPPTPQRGSCFARVGYLPLREQPGRVMPVPLFLFSEDEQLFEIIERLVHMEKFAPLPEKQFNPFPDGTALLSVSRSGGIVTVELAFPSGQPASREVTAMSRAIALTADQFPGIDRVRLMAGGEPLRGTPAGGIKADPSWRIGPGEPALLVVIGNWEESEQLKEILINFDRPLEVEKMTLSDKQGERIEGEFYRSAFDMAVVVHPEEPARFDEGTELNVEWSVVDRLGRRAAGEGDYPLVRHEHLEEHRKRD